MNQTLESTMYMLSALSQSAQIKTSRNWSDYIADQIVKAASRPSLLSMVEAFAEGVHADVEYVSSSLTHQFMQCVNTPDAPGVLRWLRKNSAIASMLLTLRKRSKKDAGEDPFQGALAEITDIISQDILCHTDCMISFSISFIAFVCISSLPIASANVISLPNNLLRASSNKIASILSSHVARD